MSLPVTRSTRRELIEGITDGVYKKVVRDRGGLVETGFWDVRQQLSVKRYGIAESPTKVCPCDVEVVTPYTVDTRDPEDLGY